MGDPASKALAGAGLGAIGGVGGGGQDLFGFGSSEFPNTNPEFLLNQGVEGFRRLGPALTNRAEAPISFGPASIAQTPAFAFGGGLPQPIGQTVSDPGFKPNRLGLGKEGFSNPFQFGDNPFGGRDFGPEDNPGDGGDGTIPTATQSPQQIIQQPQAMQQQSVQQPQTLQPQGGGDFQNLVAALSLLGINPNKGRA